MLLCLCRFLFFLVVFSPGSFNCVCNVGYVLFSKNGTAGFGIEKSETGERDGDIFQRNKTCVPVMCPTLELPENGLILSTEVNY